MSDTDTATKLKDYVGQLVDSKTKALLDELQRKESRGAVVGASDVSNEDHELASNFYEAASSGNRQKLLELNDRVEKQYVAKYGDRWAEKAQSIGTIGSGTSGGVLVPTTVADSIVSKQFYISPLRQISTVIQNMPANLQLPSENTLVQAYWVAEGSPGTDSGEVFDPNILTPHKLMGIDSFTSEILADAATNPSIQNYVEQRFAVALALAENDAFTNGDGTGKPFGFRSSAITPGSVAQAGAALAYDDVVKLKYALKTAYRKVAVYVVSSAAAQALETIKDTLGRPIWREGLAEATPATLLGRPVYIVDEIPDNLGAGTDATEIWYGDFKNYFIGDRGDLRIDYGTNGTDFANDKISLRMAKRVAGRPVIGESFAKLTGVK